MEKLNQLILAIQNEYKEISLEWERSVLYVPFNMKRVQVCDVLKNSKLLAYLTIYRFFIFNKSVEIHSRLEKVCDISSRVKLLNSIIYKINYYTQNKDAGKIPLKKCLNDMYGIRILLDDKLDYLEVYEYINDIFPNLKCINASKKGYKAIHVYFGEGNNMRFQWELQIWNKKDEKNNKILHERYKQRYTKWEQESKGGK